MQKVKLPKQLDPIKSAMKRSEYHGVFLTADMSRLCNAVADIDTQVSVDIRFEKDEQGLTFFHGKLATSASLVCQRCNETFAHPLNVDFCFSPVQGQEQESVDELPEAYEPVEVNDLGEVNLLQLFEDELILCLPIVALHAEEDCTVRQEDMVFGKLEPEHERPNPFAVLKELKRD